MINRKSPAQIDKIARAGEIVAGCLDMLRGKCRPGATTAGLDAVAERFIRERGGIPTFKGYRGFPASICASPNEVVVHGIPGDYILAEGDIISLDVGVTLKGWVADAATTVGVGEVSGQARRLMDVTETSLLKAISRFRQGNHLSDISSAVQEYVEHNGYSVVRSLVGHGIGRDMHEEPQIPNFGVPGGGPELEEGMVFAIEPMVNVGEHRVKVGDDRWAVSTADGSLSAHFEHTVALSREGPKILTAGTAFDRSNLDTASMLW
ncbi:MAG TPA: type I methionyl aminopeptidase [Actinobacteria bacterium]|nr:type I methionyl aminopeptidase [Actinomycetota bacterium]